MELEENIAELVAGKNVDKNWAEVYDKLHKTVKFWSYGDEDAAQGAWLKCFKNFHKYEDDKHFLPWMKAITVNNFIDITRTRHYKDGRAISDERDIVNELDPEDTPDVAAEREEFYDVLRECLAELKEDKPEYAECLELYSRGYSYKEISEIKQLPEGSVKSGVFYGKNELRKKLLYRGIWKRPTFGE